MSIVNEFRLWIKDQRNFMFRIPKTKGERSVWVVLVAVWVMCFTAIIISILLG